MNPGLGWCVKLWSCCHSNDNSNEYASDAGIGIDKAIYAIVTDNDPRVDSKRSKPCFSAVLLAARKEKQ